MDCKLSAISHPEQKHIVMKTVFAIVMTLAFVLSTTAAGSAHRRLHKLFVAAQVPVNSTKYRNVVIDGDLSEWDNVPPVYWVTQDDLIETVRGFNNPDASDLAVRIIIGWSPVTNKIYLIEDKYDDVSLAQIGGADETLEISIDADHSGNQQFYDVNTSLFDSERTNRFNGASSQYYHYRLHRDDSMFLWSAASWAGLPPYSDIGWSFYGEEHGPGELAVEEVFTPFDDLNFEGVDFSAIHTLKEGAVIGVGFAVRDDDDSRTTGYDGYWTNSGVTEFYFREDAMVDYLLARFDRSIWVPIPVISNDSWGRIKSTFSE